MSELREARQRLDAKRERLHEALRQSYREDVRRELAPVLVLIPQRGEQEEIHELRAFMDGQPCEAEWLDYLDELAIFSLYARTDKGIAAEFGLD